jgi:hypothetical protein
MKEARPEETGSALGAVRSRLWPGRGDARPNRPPSSRWGHGVVIAPERTGACLNFPARIKLSRRHQAGIGGSGPASRRGHRGSPCPRGWVMGSETIRSSRWWRSCAGLLPDGGARVRTHRVQPVVAVIAGLLPVVRVGWGTGGSGPASGAGHREPPSCR